MSEEIEAAERKRRIQVSLWAYAYEFENVSMVDDATFDREARLINPSIETGHERLDEFFREHFDPSTGMWVHNHPQLAKLRQLYQRLAINSVKSYTTKIEKPTEAKPAMKFDEIIEKYVEVRDRKSELTADYKAKVAKFDAVLDKIEVMILQQFEQLGTDSVKTPHGTAYKSTKSSYQVADWDSALEFIKENGFWHMLERRVAKAGIDAYKDETGELPPGLNARIETTVNIRRT